jgi:hypothetical protein
MGGIGIVLPVVNLGTLVVFLAASFIFGGT